MQAHLLVFSCLLCLFHESLDTFYAHFPMNLLEHLITLLQTMQHGHFHQRKLDSRYL